MRRPAATALSLVLLLAAACGGTPSSERPEPTPRASSSMAAGPEAAPQPTSTAPAVGSWILPLLSEGLVDPAPRASSPGAARAAAAAESAPWPDPSIDLSPLRPGEQRPFVIPPKGVLPLATLAGGAARGAFEARVGNTDVLGAGAGPMALIFGKPQQCGSGEASWLSCVPQVQCSDGELTSTGDALLVADLLAEGKWLSTGEDGSSRRGRIARMRSTMVHVLGGHCALEAPAIPNVPADRAGGCSMATDAPTAAKIRERLGATKGSTPKDAREAINLLLRLDNAGLGNTWAGALTWARCWSGGAPGVPTAEIYGYPAAKVKGWMVDLTTDTLILRPLVERTPAATLRCGWLRAVEIQRGLPFRANACGSTP